MSDLADRHCQERPKGSPPLAAADVERYRAEIDPAWDVARDRLERTFRFPDFRQALAFTNRVGELAEQESHHPDLALSWGKVTVELSTHSVGGLSENDFILAAKIDRLD